MQESLKVVHLYLTDQPHVVFKSYGCELRQMENQNQSKAEVMRLHIEACSKSGLTVSDYCLQNGLVKSGYYYWLKNLNGENKSSRFTAINIAKSESVEITYPNGVQLSFTGDINAATVKVLVCCI